MKKAQPSPKDNGTKKGYNEKNPSQPQGAFPPASDEQKSNEPVKSNTAEKKDKEASS